MNMVLHGNVWYNSPKMKSEHQAFGRSCLPCISSRRRNLIVDSGQPFERDFSLKASKSGLSKAQIGYKVAF